MEFNFNITDIFNEPIVEIKHDLIPPGFRGDRRTLWNAINRVSEVVNAVGTASAAAQGLPKPVTTTERLKNSQHKLYLLIDRNANAGRGAVAGMLKTGAKGLYIFDKEGQYHHVSPPCLLDFYVHESRQRKGLGKQLFQHMLQKESVDPSNIAIDKPSQQLMSFLNKHYGLNSPVKQTNNFVVFEGFFPKKETQSFPQQIPKRLGLVRKESANGLQSRSSPFGRYAASKPATNEGKLLHNDMEDQNRTITSMPILNRSEPLTRVRESQSTPIYTQQSTGHNQGVGSTMEHRVHSDHPVNRIDSNPVNVPSNALEAFRSHHQSKSVPSVHATNQMKQNQYPMEDGMSHETTNSSPSIPTRNEMSPNHFQGIQSLAHIRPNVNHAYQRNDQILSHHANEGQVHQENHTGYTQSMGTMNQQNQIRHIMPGIPMQNQNLYQEQQYSHNSQMKVGEKANDEHYQSVDMMNQHQNIDPYQTPMPNGPMKSIPEIPTHIQPTRFQPHPDYLKNPQGVQSLPQFRAGEQLPTGHQLYAQESPQNTPMEAVHARVNQSSPTMNASQPDMRDYGSHVGENRSVEGQLQPGYMQSQRQGDNPEPTLYQQNQLIQPHTCSDHVAGFGSHHQQMSSQSSSNANPTSNIQTGYSDGNQQASTKYITAAPPQFSRYNPAEQCQIIPEESMQYQQAMPTGTGKQQMPMISDEQIQQDTMNSTQNAISSRIVPGDNSSCSHSGDAMQHRIPGNQQNIVYDSRSTTRFLQGVHSGDTMQHQIPGNQHNVVYDSRYTTHFPQEVQSGDAMKRQALGNHQNVANTKHISHDRSVSVDNQEKPPTDISCEQTINNPNPQKHKIDPLNSRNMSNPNYISQVQYNPLQKTPVASRTTVPMEEGVLEYGYPPQLSRAQALYFRKPDVMSIN